MLPPPTATARSWRPTSDVEDAQGYASAAGGRALQRQQLVASSWQLAASSQH